MELIHLLETHYGLTFTEFGSRYRCNEHDGLIVFKDSSKAYDYSLNFTTKNDLNQIFDVSDIQRKLVYLYANITDSVTHFQPKAPKYIKEVAKSVINPTIPIIPKWLKKDVGFNFDVVSFLQNKIGGQYLDSTIVNPIIDKHIKATFAPCQRYGLIRYQYNTQAEYIKLKAINTTPQNKYKKYYQEGNFKNYIFGDFNHNPKDEAVFLCGGEDDTLALLAHGFNAVCGSSETSNINHIISKAKRLNKRIICAYDNDITGQTQAQKLKEQYNIKTLEFGIYKNYCKDICDVVGFLANENLATAKQRFTYWIKYNSLELSTIDHHPKQYKNRTAFAKSTRFINVKQYASEAIEELKSLIHFTGQYKALNAPAGTGKTYAMQMLMNDNFLKIIGCKKVVFSVPTTTIAAQTKKDIDKHLGINTPIISSDDKNTFEDKQNAKDAKFVVSVYDSTIDNKINDLKDAFLIIDEAHFLVSEQYRLKALIMLQSKAKECRKVLFLSATHSLNYLRLRNVDTLTIKPQVKNKLRLYVYTYSDSSKAEIVNLAELIAKDYDSTMFVLNDKNYLKSSYFRDNVFNADDKKSEQYKTLINDGIAPPFFAATELLKAGASIKSEVQSIILANVKDTSDIIQFCNRPRLQPDGTNETIDVHLIVKAEKTPHTPNLSYLWKLVSDSKDELKMYVEDDTQTHEENKLFLSSEAESKIKILNVLAYYKSAIKLSTKRLIDTIIKIDDRFELVELEDMDGDSDRAQQIKEDAKELKSKQDASFIKLQELANKSTNHANKILLSLCTDGSQIDKLIKANHLNTTSICTFDTKENLEAFRQQHKECFEHSRKMQERLDIALEFTKLNMDKTNLAQKILTSNPTELNRYKKLLKYKENEQRYKAKDNRLNQQNTALYEAQKQAIKTLKRYKTDKRPITKERLEKIIVQGIKSECKKKGFTSFTGYKKKDAIDFLHTFFDAELIRERKGKNWKVSYLIKKYKVTGL